MDYTTRTRKDWNDFDIARTKAFQYTEQELLEQEQERIIKEKKLIYDKLIERWIQLPTDISKERVLWALQMLNAKQYIWDDLEWWLEWQIELHWDLSNAIDNLVLTYL